MKWLASLVLVPCQGLVVKAIVVLATLKLKKEEDEEWKDTVIIGCLVSQEHVPF